jgi:uncharacterized membrane protein (DUF485 family)
MGNNSAFGSLARKAIAWAIVAVVAILLFKIVFAILAGFVQMLMAIALLVFVAYAVVWAIRRL